MDGLEQLICLETGDADVAPYLAHARFLEARGESERALLLLRATALVAPCARSAWWALAEAHRSAGDDESADVISAFGDVIAHWEEDAR